MLGRKVDTVMEKSNMTREVAKLNHGAIHEVEIVVCLSWLAVVSTLGMTREENGFLLAQGGGSQSPSNHPSVAMNRYLNWQFRVSNLNIMLLVSSTVCKVEESHRDHKGFHSLVVEDMMALGMQQSSLGMV